MHIKIHTQGWRGSSARKEGEEASGLFNGILEVDGELYAEVTDIKCNFSGANFATVDVTFIPGDVDVVNHNDDTWSKLIQEMRFREQRAVASRADSDGRMIAVYVSPDSKENQ